MTTMFFQTNTDPKVDFSFENGQVTLYGNISSIEGKDFIYGVDKANPLNPLLYFFKLMSPIPSDNNPFDRGLPISVEYYIYDYNSRYNEIIFSFPFLDFFLAKFLIGLEQDKNGFIHCHEDEYQCKFHNHDLFLKFYAKMEKYELSNYRFSYTSSGKLRVRSEQNFDTDFAFQVIRYIHGLFSFIYRRADISVGKVELIGSKNVKIDNQEMCMSSKSILVPQESYNESDFDYRSFDPSKDVDFSVLKTNFTKLINMNFYGEILFCYLTKYEQKSYDLKHVLWINFCFDHYFDIFTKTFNCVIKFRKDNEDRDRDIDVSMLKDLINRLTYIYNPDFLINKNDRCARGRIVETLTEWRGCIIILNKHCRIPFVDLMEEYINCRNAHAHGNIKYDLRLKDPQVIVNAIRIVEAMNYCMVLRLAGYSNETICDIIDNNYFNPKY